MSISYACAGLGWDAEMRAQRCAVPDSPHSFLSAISSACPFESHGIFAHYTHALGIRDATPDQKARFLSETSPARNIQSCRVGRSHRGGSVPSHSPGFLNLSGTRRRHLVRHY